MVSANGRWVYKLQGSTKARVNTPPHSVPVFSGNDPLISVTKGKRQIA